MRQKLGERHPLALSCAVDLANCRGDSGDLKSAEAMERQAVRLLKEVLGDDHPDTLVCEANLIVTLHQAGWIERAETLRNQILDRFSKTLAPEHPLARPLEVWQRIDLELEALRI
jgi:hypothetical protein